MKKSIYDAARPLFLAVSTVMLVACFRPSSPPSYEYEPLATPVSAAQPQCPDLSGTYRLTPGSRESGLFSPYLLPPHQMDMVQLTRNSSDGFSYRLKMDKARFVEQVSMLRTSNPAGYATWHELITQWQQNKREKKETSVLEGKILELGPLPERSGLLTPTLCEGFWGMVTYHNADPVGLDDDEENARSTETETRLSRSKEGALLFRYDNYRTRSIIFNSTVRTGIINSAYAKLAPMQHALFDWEITEAIAPHPFSERERRTKLVAVLNDLEQFATSRLPAGANMNHFRLDDASERLAFGQNIADGGNMQNGDLWISMKGDTASNREVSDLMRALSENPQLENVELSSVRHLAQDKIEFEFRLKLKDLSR